MTQLTPDPQVEPGDLVVLTGEGCNRSANELMAIWTVKNVRDDSAMVEMHPEKQTVEDLPVLSPRRYLLTWLVLYRSQDTGFDTERADAWFNHQHCPKSLSFADHCQKAIALEFWTSARRFTRHEKAKKKRGDRVTQAMMQVVYK